MGAVSKAISGIFGGGEKAPKAPEPITPPPAANPPTLADAKQAGAVGASNAGKALAGAAYAGTLMTSPQGLKQKAPTAATSLLGGTE